MAKECNCPPPGAPAWMATFGDMMSLLLTFFVLLLSFANMDVQKFKDAMASIQGALVGGPTTMREAPNTSMLQLSDTASNAVVPPVDTTPGYTPGGEAEERPDTETVAAGRRDLEALASLQEMIDDEGMGDNVEVEATPRGLVVRVKGHLFFEGGADTLRKSSAKVLDEIAAILDIYPYDLTIEGHTDNVPIHTARFPSNWELSTARAIAVMRYLHKTHHVPSSRMAVAGYADTHPLYPNDTPAHRKANRRGEFVFHQGEETPRVIDSPLGLAPKLGS